jgi:replicative DNA helicase
MTTRKQQYKKNQQPTSSLTELGFIPPQAIELEEAVLGAILCEKEAFSSIEEILNDTDFYHTQHQMVFRAVQELNRAQKPIDILTVVEEMKNKGQLEEVGGPVFIAQLTEKVASSAHLVFHAQIVKEKSIQRQAILLGQEINVKISNSEDIGDVLFQLGKGAEALQEALIGKMKGAHISSSIKGAIESMYSRIELARKNIRSGIDTGLNDLNKKTNGWQGSDLVIIAARPAMGKTAIALHYAKSAARQGIPVAIFSLEMSDISLANRLLLSECDVDPEHFKSGYLTNEEVKQIEQAAGSLWKLPIYVDDNPCVSMDYIRSKSRLLNKQGKCNMIIADYLQLASGEREKNGNREQEVAQMSRTAKITAKELNIPFILLSQLNRGNESRPDKKPLLSDLRESGAIEQDADIVCFIHRPEYYGIPVTDKNGNAETNYGEIIIAKHRNGATGTVKFKHNDGMTQFFDYSGQSTPF